MLRAIGTAALATLLAFPAPGWAAEPLLSGSGYFSPGLPTTGCAAQTIEFEISLGGLGLAEERFEGQSSVCETLLSGAGSGTFDNDVRVCHATYDRVLGLLTTRGDGCSYSCVITPTSANPVTTFRISCVASIGNTR